MRPVLTDPKGLLVLLFLCSQVFHGDLSAKPQNILQEQLLQFTRTMQSPISQAQLAIALDLHQQCQDTKTCPAPQWARLLGAVAYRYLVDGRPDICLSFLNDQSQLLDIQNCEDKELIGNATLLKAQALASIGDMDGSKSALGFALRNFGDSPIIWASANANLGALAIMEHNYGQGRDYLNHAVEMSTALYGPMNTIAAKSFNNLAQIEIDLRNWAKAEEFLQQSLHIKESLYGPDSPAIVSVLVNLSSNAFEQNHQAAALSYARRAAQICTQHYGPLHPGLRPILIDMSIYYEAMAEKDSALACLSQCLAINAGPYPADNPDVVRSYLAISDCYLGLGMPDLARKYILLAAKQIDYDPHRPLDFEHLRSLDELTYLLACQEKEFRYWAASKPIYRDSVTQSLYQQLAIFEYRMLQPASTADRQLSTQMAYPLFESLLNQLYETDSVGNVGRMFEIMERSKSRLLREEIQQSKIEGYEGLPPQVLMKEAELDEKIAQSEAHRFAMAAGQVSKMEMQKASQDLLNARREKLKFVAQLRHYFPDYYRLRYAANVISLAELQVILPQNRSFLSYFEGDSAIFIACINVDQARILRLPKDPAFATQIQQFKWGIMGYWANRDRDPRLHYTMAQAYCRAAFGLYTRLLAPIRNFLQEELVIVPDGVLHYLPFDALLCAEATDPIDFRSHDYLLQHFLVSYHHSATLYAEPRKVWSKAKQPLLAVAPQFQRAKHQDGATGNLQAYANAARAPWGALQHNASEAEAIAEIWDGHALTGQAATLTQFRAMAQNYQILHLATHAKSDAQMGELSYIAFAPDAQQISAKDRLYAHDLFNTQIHAELVVLSACETGIGELRRGEGMISLSRGFLYAGVGCTVTSLWAVDDAHTEQLMASFHQCLKQGMHKDAALRQAKLAFIQASDYPHPYFWAGFVPIGNMAPLKEDRAGMLGLLLLALAIAGFVYLGLKDDW